MVMKNCGEKVVGTLFGKRVTSCGKEAGGYSYLGAVGAGTSVGHGEKTLLGVLELEVLVGELG